MPPFRTDPVAVTRAERFEQLLAKLSQEGINQSRIAVRTGLPPQYISDVKMGRRTVTELFARRLADVFGVDYEWLIGKSASESVAAHSTAPITSLALVTAPIVGDPRDSKDWTGTYVDVTALIARRAEGAIAPYILKFGAVDRRGRIAKGDFLLMSQNPAGDAPIKVVQVGKTLYLARRVAGRWEPLARALKPIAYDVDVVGECLGIVWGAM